MPIVSAKLKYVLLSVIFLLGYTSLSFELIVLRQLINFVGSNTLITSIVITFILLFLSVGYYLGSTIKMAHRPVRLMMLKFLKILTIWYVISCSYFMIQVYFLLAYMCTIKSSLGFVSIFSAVFLALPSVCLGFITSVIGRIIHRHNEAYTGRFMAIDTLGSVCGSLATTLIFMPLIGVGATIVVLTLLTAASALLLEKKNNFVFSCFIYLLYVTFGWVLNNNQIMSPIDSYLVKDDAISRIELTKEDFINGTPQSILMTINGSSSSKISKDRNLMFGYVNFINDTFIKNMPQDKPHDILVLGAGGFTIGIDDTFNNYTFLDIDKDLQNIAEDLFLQKPLTNNKKFIAQDAYLYMLNNKQKYDLIVVDIFSSRYSIPMNFVTADFFAMIKAHLKNNGIMVANIITSAAFQSSFAKRLDNTLRAVFPFYLDRKVLQPYNPYNKDDLVNVEYIFYNYKADTSIYTLDKNTAVYGQ